MDIGTLLRRVNFRPFAERRDRHARPRDNCFYGQEQETLSLSRRLWHLECTKCEVDRLERRSQKMFLVGRCLTIAMDALNDFNSLH